MRYLIAMLLIVGCGKSHVDSEFTPYVDAFRSAANTQGASLNAVGLSIEFGDDAFGNTVATSGTTSSENALCENAAIGSPKVTVSRAFWKNASESARELTIFHELGHCLLGRKHLDDTTLDPYANKLFKSLMNHTGTVGDDNWVNHRDAYVHELFHPGEFSL